VYNKELVLFCPYFVSVTPERKWIKFGNKEGSIKTDWANLNLCVVKNIYPTELIIGKYVKNKSKSKFSGSCDRASLT